jgi:hypothetical protein
MNKLKKTPLQSALALILMTAGLTCGVYASTDSQQTIGLSQNGDTAITQAVASQELAEPKFVVLEDKLHSINDSLTSRYPVHYYGFVAKRGQDVILGFLGGDPVKNAWKVEYYENGEWRTQNMETKVFSNLKPEAEVIIRVMPRHPENGTDISYSLNFGSWPVLKKYDLHDEPGVIRIPSGYTEPGWLATQVYKEALLEVKFEDTKGASLEGGMAFFRLSFGIETAPVELHLISDANGLASKRIELGRCHGGKEAQDFVDKHMGFNTWRSHYIVGGYFVQNSSSATMTTPPHLFHLGHICSQRLVQTVRPRN